MLLLGTVCSGASAQSPREWTEDHLSELLAFYQQQHRHPELSFQETETARRLGQALQEAGYEVTFDVGGRGLVALLSHDSGPTVMVRTDLDALPITEQTRLPFASEVRVTDENGLDVGVMHACGHDLHMTNLLGVGRYLSEHRDRWSGTVMLIGQPAEERGAGARAMLDDGLFERFPRPDFALALHVDAALETGKIGCREGYTLANVDSVDITLKGRGGHGAYPHTTIDPIVQAAHLIVDLQSIVSREIEPTEPAVVTVGSVHGGTKHNIIPDECHLQLTVRSYKPTVRQHLLDAIRRKASAVAASADAEPPEIKVSEGTPALFNDQQLTERLLPVFSELLGPANVEVAELSMGGEDFSRYGLAGVPILMFRLGSVEPQRLERYRQLGQEPPSLHSPAYYPDAAPALLTGVPAMSAAVLELLRKEEP